MPKFVIMLCFLAIYPSKKSVAAAKINTARAAISSPSEFLHKRSMKTGINIILNMVSLFAVFIKRLAFYDFMPINSPAGQKSITLFILTYAKSPGESFLSDEK